MTLYRSMKPMKHVLHPLFRLPPQEMYQPVTRHDDPLRYYYKPIIGRLYIKRLQDGIGLLNHRYRRILDFGFGSGLLFNTLDSIADELHGIDLLSDIGQLEHILHAQGMRAFLRKGDILEADYPAEHFDLITAFSVFEHIADFEPILEEMKRILCPGGHLLIGMPRVSPGMTCLFKAIGFGEIDEHHVTSHHQVRATARRHFQLVKSKRLPSFLPQFMGLYFNMLFVKTPDH